MSPFFEGNFDYNLAMSQFYTRTGDNGYTGLLGEDRVPKYHPRLEAIGAIDESMAALGMARAICRSPFIVETILVIQRDLYTMMAEVAATPVNAEAFRKINSERTNWLEVQIDSAIIQLENPDSSDHVSSHLSIKGFILPGDSQAGAALDVARTIVRRAERRVTHLIHTHDLENMDCLHYLNRLSSLCFVLELLENQAAGITIPTAAKG